MSSRLPGTLRIPIRLSLLARVVSSAPLGAHPCSISATNGQVDLAEFCRMLKALPCDAMSAVDLHSLAGHVAGWHGLELSQFFVLFSNPVARKSVTHGMLSIVYGQVLLCLAAMAERSWIGDECASKDAVEPMYDLNNARHTRANIARYLDAGAAAMQGQCLALAGPDGTKVGTDFLSP